MYGMFTNARYESNSSLQTKKIQINYHSHKEIPNKQKMPSESITLNPFSVLGITKDFHIVLKIGL